MGVSAAEHRLRALAGNLLDAAFDRPWRLFSVFFLLIVALKWPFFTIPPVWDEAFSIFPAADFLVDNGFDYRLLLEQPRYHDGGPKTHGLSLLTLVTALILKITGGGTPAWMVLHSLQWLMAAAIGAVLARIFSTVFARTPSFLLAFACLAYPVVLTQLGFMYLEVPTLFFTVLAFFVFLKERIWLASLFLVLACLIKGSALIGVGALSLTALLCPAGLPWARRVLNSAILAVPSLITANAYVTMLNGRQAPSDQVATDFISTIIQRNLAAYHGYLSLVPEALFILIAGLAFAIFFLFHNRKTSGLSKSERRIVDFNGLFIVLFCIFYTIIYNFFQTSDSHFLTRYLAYVVPSLFFIIFYAIKRYNIKEIFKIFVLLFAIFIFIFNRNGLLYPTIQFSSIAMAERSEEYINGYFIQKEYISFLENDVSEDIPIFVNLPDFFLTQYQVNDYVSKPLLNVRYIVHALNEFGPNFQPPEHFVLVYSYPWLGAQYIMHMFQKASMSDDYTVEVIGNFSRGFFSANIFSVKRKK